MLGISGRARIRSGLKNPGAHRTGQERQPSDRNHVPGLSQNFDSSKAMTLVVIKFDSIAAVDAHYDLVRGSMQTDDAVDLTEGVDGPWSF